MSGTRMRARQLTALLQAAIAGVALIGDAAVAAPTAAENRVAIRAEELLSAYAANDQKAVLAMVDPHRLTVYGSDIAEVINGGEAFGKMMTDDFALWKTAKLGRMQDLSIRVGGELATAFFNAPFSAGGQPPVLVRFATVWHRFRGKWLLTQSSNSVPTVGSSAAEILKSAPQH